MMRHSRQENLLACNSNKAWSESARQMWPLPSEKTSYRTCVRTMNSASPFIPTSTSIARPEWLVRVGWTRQVTWECTCCNEGWKMRHQKFRLAQVATLVMFQSVSARFVRPFSTVSSRSACSEPPMIPHLSL